MCFSHNQYSSLCVSILPHLQTYNKKIIFFEDIDEFDMSLICSDLHCDTQYFINDNVRNNDLLISTMNRGNDSVKSRNIKAKIQDFINDFTFINEIFLED